MLNEILEAAKAGRLIVKTCIDQATNEQVEVLCIDTGNKVRPVGKLYPDFDYARADVLPPEGHSVDDRLLH
jgi:hypothetical protein